jgi:lysozyme family protein
MKLHRGSAAESLDHDHSGLAVGKRSRTESLGHAAGAGATAAVGHGRLPAGLPFMDEIVKSAGDQHHDEPAGEHAIYSQSAWYSAGGRALYHDEVAGILPVLERHAVNEGGGDAGTYVFDASGKPMGLKEFSAPVKEGYKTLSFKNNYGNGSREQVWNYWFADGKRKPYLTDATMAHTGTPKFAAKQENGAVDVPGDLAALDIAFIPGTKSCYRAAYSMEIATGDQKASGGGVTLDEYDPAKRAEMLDGPLDSGHHLHVRTTGHSIVLVEHAGGDAYVVDDPGRNLMGDLERPEGNFTYSTKTANDKLQAQLTRSDGSKVYPIVSVQRSSTQPKKEKTETKSETKSETTTTSTDQHETTQVAPTIQAETPADDSKGSGPPDYMFMFNYLMKWEGGLSRDTHDAASKNPCPATHDGLTGWHTNKGITWTTFQGAASSCGHSKTDYDLFFEMPVSLVQKIFKTKYWDKVQGDHYNSQAVANIFTQWAWGSGAGGALSLLQKLVPTVGSWAAAPEIINAMIAEQGERAVFEALMNHRRDFLISLSGEGSTNAKYQKGWLRRHDDFYKLNEGALQ